jgi:FAD/FMN-containing dehydrogenase
MTRGVEPLADAEYRSWGGTVAGEHLAFRPRSLAAARAALAAAASGAASVLPFGNGRSYGDVGLNPGGALIDCRGLDRFIDFDRRTGILTCEAGVRLADILAALGRPEADGSAWLPAVSPGTRLVTVGGAIANDVHGKNHHQMGCFGRHVLGFELARSDGRIIACSPHSEPALFAATIGGLGLTGLILSARLQLRRVAGSAVEAEDIRFAGLADFFALSEESGATWEYTAAWMDCLARGAALGRGIFSRARHRPGIGAPPPAIAPRIAIPFAPPISPLNRLSLLAFNTAYFHRLGRGGRRRRVGSYEPVLYPLDRIGGWNRLYGRRGFFQFQCVVPTVAARDAIAALLGRIAASGQGSLLAVLKNFGDMPSPGLLSFPLPGTTLALDFPDRGEPTRQLLGELETIVVAAGGRLYPAKDATMRTESFWQGYPQAGEFLRHLDPAMSSGFARRVGLDRRPAAAAAA